MAKDIRTQIIAFIDKGCHKQELVRQICKECETDIDTTLTVLSDMENDGIVNSWNDWFVVNEFSPNESAKMNMVKNGLVLFEQGDTITYCKPDGDSVTALVDLVLDTITYEDEIMIVSFSDERGNDHNLEDCKIVSIKESSELDDGRILTKLGRAINKLKHQHRHHELKKETSYAESTKIAIEAMELVQRNFDALTEKLEK